jgi:hypothetical protein
MKFASILTYPLNVNFKEFASKLMRIYLKLFLSVKKILGTFSPIS